MTALVIRGGYLIDPAAGVDGLRDVLLKDGKVAEIAAPGKLKLANGAEVLDATGLTLAPGLVDMHVHLREPGQGYKETIASGTAAAATGGFTSVAAMPNTTPVNDSPETTRWMLQPERKAAIRVFPIAAATRGSKGEAINDYAALKAAGAVAVSDDGRPILKDNIMRETLAAAARVGLSVIQHAEDTRMTQGGSMNAGPVAFKLGLRGMPAEAESSIVERDIRLVTELRDTRAHLHVAHISTAAALAAVRQARRSGLRVTCEVAPHHFLLTDEHVGLYNTNAKMCPPLRSTADRDAMIEGILDGVVDAIATDHAPHAVHEKEVEFENAPNGILGLETALGLSLHWLHKEWKLPLGRVLSLLSAQPAALLGLKGRGTLAVGSFADVVIFDPKAEWTYRAAEGRSKSKNTPFEGWTMQGKVRWTISEGRIAYTA
ncbi:MAG: dihydroorotase [Terracidiphilus sp.]|nr:dihydroorotase [Terracidiphilus sp.]MDR3776349.1 dihydroorotase [Terracidiphilus sp.]